MESLAIFRPLSGEVAEDKSGNSHNPQISQSTQNFNAISRVYEYQGHL